MTTNEPSRARVVRDHAVWDTCCLAGTLERELRAELRSLRARMDEAPPPPAPALTHTHTYTHTESRALACPHARVRTHDALRCFNTVRSTSPCCSSVRARNVATRWRCSAHRTTYNSHYSRSGPLAFVLKPFEALRLRRAFADRPGRCGAVAWRCDDSAAPSAALSGAGKSQLGSARHFSARQHRVPPRVATP